MHDNPYRRAVENAVSRLSRAETAREIVAGDAAAVTRYLPAIYDFLYAQTGDHTLAESLTSDFCERFCAGHFRRYDASRGRFRHYLKQSLRNLVRDHFRRAKPSGPPVDAVAITDEAPSDFGQDDEFDHHCREQLLDTAWQSLERLQQDTGTPYSTVLRLRSEGVVAAEELQRRVAELTGNAPPSVATMRKWVSRAVAHFADALVDAVARSLATQDLEGIEEELIDLDLLRYCRPQLRARRG